MDPEIVAKIVKSHVLPMFRGNSQKRVYTNNSTLNGATGAVGPKGSIQMVNTVQGEL